MSVSVWPPIPPHELLQKAAESLDHDLQWIIQDTLSICQELKHGLEDCYALLAPIDPGSTLVMSTSRSERVKGTITRVGTRVVKGSLNLQLKTIPVQNISLAQNHDIHVQPLERLHTNLTQAIDLLGITLSSDSTPSAGPSLASTLSLLSESFTESITLLKGSPSQTDAWRTSSSPPSLFTPDPGPNLSFYLTIEDCAMVLYLRALEPVDAPVHLGLKLGLALGTFRRLEHDEMDVVFKYDASGRGGVDGRRHGHDAQHKQTGTSGAKIMEDVYVREKVRVDTGDPNLISLHSKLLYLSRTLGQAQSNLAAVMGTDTIE